MDLKQEIEHTQAFLNIEQARFHDRLKIIIDVEENLEEILIPPLTLQPLVENAIKHGLKDVICGGVVSIQINKIDNKVQFVIQDNGIGISLSNAQKHLRQKNISSDSGLGLNNVHQRLIGHFGAKAGLDIKNAPEGGTVITFELPLRKGENYELKSGGSR